MKESIPLYAIADRTRCLGIVWETELGKIVTLQDDISIQNNLSIRDIKTGDEVNNIDLRNVLMSILPR